MEYAGDISVGAEGKYAPVSRDGVAGVGSTIKVQEQSPFHVPSGQT